MQGWGSSAEGSTSEVLAEDFVGVTLGRFDGPVRVEIFASTNGRMGDEPFGFVVLNDPATAGAEIASLLRGIADEFERL